MSHTEEYNQDNEDNEEVIIKIFDVEIYIGNGMMKHVIEGVNIISYTLNNIMIPMLIVIKVNPKDPNDFDTVAEYKLSDICGIRKVNIRNA